jgi:hypothetical protein
MRKDNSLRESILQCRDSFDAPILAGKKDNKKVALKPYVKDCKVEFEIVGQDKPFPKDFEPEKGTVSRAIAHCLVCRSTKESF